MLKAPEKPKHLLKWLESNPLSIKTHIVVTNARKEEYENSNYSITATFYFINGEHFLHWTNEKEILDILDKLILSSLKSSK